MTAFEKIVRYLKNRKTPATAPEIAKYAGVNYNTVRRIVGEVCRFHPSIARKCRVTHKYLLTYSEIACS